MPNVMKHPQRIDFLALLKEYEAGTTQPREYLTALREKILRNPDQSKIWISVVDEETLDQWIAALEEKSSNELPLYGVPFAVKDNIDVAGFPTTGACPDASYAPEETAFVVHALMNAGAIPMGKTNLDQFATGLVGTRSPYGIAPNSCGAEFIPGGSSSGSASAVGFGEAAFSLGTDTAGSGRVPAAFQNLVGLKPTRGLLSCQGVIPACRTLDCVSIFANSLAEAEHVLAVAAQFDPKDAYARPVAAPNNRSRDGVAVIGVPREADLEFFGDESARTRFGEAVDSVKQSGATVVEVDFQPFLEAARLLYEGPWVAERYAAIEDIITERPEILHPVTRSIIEGGGKPSAVDAFRAQYKLADKKRLADAVWETVDAIMTPTTGTIYTIDEVLADPVALNSNLGYYTNFMNLLDYAAVAVPAGELSNGMPFGVTYFAPAFSDQQLLDIAGHDFNARSEERLQIAVCGAHMDGLALNHQLTERGGRFCFASETAPSYRFFALPPTESLPPRPGLIRVPEGEGHAIHVEVWDLDPTAFGDFVSQIPAPLGVGKVVLSDGVLITGFLCEQIDTEGAREISDLGSWREFLKRG